MRVGEIVKEVRLDRGMSLREFSRECGLSASYVSMIERGRLPSYSAAVTIAEKFGREDICQAWVDEQNYWLRKMVG